MKKKKILQDLENTKLKTINERALLKSKTLLEAQEIREENRRYKELNNRSKSSGYRFSSSALVEDSVNFVQHIKIKILTGVGCAPVPDEICNNLTFLHPIENIVGFDPNRVNKTIKYMTLI